MQEIKKKGFSMTPDREVYNSVDFSKIKVGVKTLNDAVLNLGDYKRLNNSLGDKEKVFKAIRDNDYETMFEISNFFYKTSGIYARLCRYMARIYYYDWKVTPHIGTSAKNEKVVSVFNRILTLFDNFEIKKFCGDVALKVLRNGCYYGYVVKSGTDKISVQELPPKYCRSRFKVGEKPAIEFDMRFFDTAFKDTVQRNKILNLFPKEFKKGYILYKEGKLVPDFPGDTAGWYLLDIDCAIKFNLNGEDYPPFINAIPAIIDLNEAQALDRKKMQQKLLKIIIQKMPIDKNGDLIFDVDEAQQLHNNAVRMLSKAIGVDVLTTFADVDVADMADKNTTTTVDDLEKVERSLYNEAGTSQAIFNTDSNLALEKSVLNDETTMYDLLLQFESFFNNLLEPFNTTPKKMFFKLEFLKTTTYNWKDYVKYFKENTQLGYSKMLPQIALGQSQSSILADAYFENNVLDLVNVFIPPLMSSTMNADVLNKNGGEESAGRKELDDDKKSDKTIANRESMS